MSPKAHFPGEMLNEVKELEVLMPVSNRGLLDVLKCELNFLGKGGYRRSAQAPWRGPLIFEDSPTCKSYYREQNARPCGECLLLQFVPPGMRERKVACRYIPLNTRGDSLDSFYRVAYEPEIEEAVGQWLESNIERLETELNCEAGPGARARNNSE